jgi:3-phosphoshikimate 1-carboxyvinyltransferase
MEAVFLKSEGLRGVVRVPGDKSISHRAAIVAALGGESFEIRNFSPAADCASTLGALREVGVDVSVEPGLLRVVGRADRGFKQPSAPLDAGNSGTTMRLLAGALASQPLDLILTGDESLRGRPMGRIIEPLTLMGASVQARDREGHPPLHIHGGKLKGVEYASPVASAQVKSSVLLAGLGASGSTTVIEPVSTRDHTERMLAHTGIEIEREGLAVTVKPGVPQGGNFDIPGDVSSAAFFIVAALLCPGSSITVSSVGLNPTRTAFLDLFKKMGADIEVKLEVDDGWEPRGSIFARYGGLNGVRVGSEEVARSIDEITLLALLATQAEGITEISGADELRHKESDRIRNTVSALDALGADIKETEDGMVVCGPSHLNGTAVSAGRDHRIAMMLSLAGLIADGRTVVKGWEWTDISFPGFTGILTGLGARVQ